MLTEIEKNLGYPLPLDKFFRSPDDLRLWHDSHNGCQLLRSQNSPPIVTGVMWSTTVAVRPQELQVGCLAMNPTRALLHAVDQ